MNVRRIELQDVISKLPNIVELNFDDREPIVLYIMFLGFEDRCTSIINKIIKNNINIENLCIINYSSNEKDNAINKPKLAKLLKQLKCSQTEFIDGNNFYSDIKKYLESVIKQTNQPSNVCLDISTGSSKLIVTMMKILFDYNISLKVLYAEAQNYLPSVDEFYKDKQLWSTEEGFGISKGIGEVIVNPEFTGSTEDKPNYIISFPTFKPERTKAIFTYIDESFNTSFDLTKVVYFVGCPNMKEKEKQARMEMVKEINNIQDNNCMNVSTLDYKDTLRSLYKVYQEHNLQYRINISALGSKMQAIGIAIFCNTFNEVAVYHAVPKQFNAKEYSSGTKQLWMIDFKEIKNIQKYMNLIGQLRLENETIEDI